MLWYKGWFETRIKLSISLGFMVVLLVFVSTGDAPPPGTKAVLGLSIMTTAFSLVVYTWLAGAGIVTQPGFQATKGLHGSTLFTLSLPVSRFRLLAVRATLGWLEMAAVIGMLCGALWLASTLHKGTVTAIEMLEYAVTLVGCVSTFYFLSVFLATFLDDLWRMWAGMIAFGGLWFLSSHVPLPASVNIFRAMGEGSPLLTHTMPWTALAFSLGLAAILFFAALKIVRTREY
jgi:hypothetical protein